MKSSFICNIILFGFLLNFFSCIDGAGSKKTSNNKIESSNSNSFNEVGIGSRIWMKENLNVEKFRNGDVIMEAKTKEEWIQAGVNEKAAWCYYDNDPANGDKYGKLYNWFAVNDSRELAPEGWHIPTSQEIIQLNQYLGGGKIAISKLQSFSGWGGNGNNESGFNALPGGIRDDRGNAYEIGRIGDWWTSSSSRNKEGSINVSSFGEIMGFNSLGACIAGDPNCPIPFTGLSVRCLKD